jgi:hypothetical protein
VSGSRQAPRPLKLAYADPPYPGKAHLYPEKTEVDHAELISRLCEYDGWALSTDEKNLQYVLSLAPVGVRVLAWCKPDAVPFHGPWQSWEPVLCVPARPELAQVRSYQVCNGPPRGFLGKTFTGSKPAGFCEWVIRCLGADQDDSLDDLFPGSGAMSRSWERFCSQLQIPPQPRPSHIGKMQILRRSHPQLPGMPDPRVARERQNPERNVA